MAVRLDAFIEDMATAYQWADLVLCRAGALTVAELTVMGRPAVLVPLPNAIDNHQARNAEWLAGRGAAVILAQSEMTPESVAVITAAHAAARPGATLDVADACEEVRRGR